MNKTTVAAANSQLAYFAGVLRAARADVQQVEERRADYPADTYGEVLKSYHTALTQAEKDFRFEWQACQALEELAAMPDTPAQAAPVATSKPQERCPHWKAIKRVYAIAKERGLDTSRAGKARMRHTMESTLGRCVNSRGEYSGADWQAFGDAVKSGRAAW